MNFSELQRAKSYLSYQGERLIYKSVEWYKSQPLYKQILIAVLGVLGAIVGFVLLINIHNVFDGLLGISNTVKHSTLGLLIVWALTVLVAFPPLIGFSALCALTGMVFGVSITGYVFITSATAVGSTLCFILFKYLLANKAKKLLETSRFFSAVASVLGQDKDKLMILCLVNLCPRPYSISNAGLASIPELDAKTFFLATIIASPKLLVSLYVGAKLQDLGQDKDIKSKTIDFFSMALAAVAYSATGWIIYVKTRQRLASLGSDIALDDPEEESYSGLLNGRDGEGEV